MIRCLVLSLLLLPALAFARPLQQPAPLALPLSPPALCEAAIAGAEVQQSLPARVLHAISLRESGRYDPETGRTRPWPWTINFEGTGRTFATKDAAIAAVRDIQAAGGASIDVGCMQVNLMHHPDAFASLDDAFDPISNAAYAGHFLHALFVSLGDWGAAIGAYHSRTPGVGEPYRDQVVATWNPSDPAVLARLSLQPASLAAFPMIAFPAVSSDMIPTWQPARIGPIIPLRGAGLSGSAYRAFLPPSVVYADFAPKTTRSRVRPIDFRLATGLVDGNRGLVVPKGVIDRMTVKAQKPVVVKPAALNTTAKRPGAAG
jgi:hypothetical protein